MSAAAQRELQAVWDARRTNRLDGDFETKMMTLKTKTCLALIATLVIALSASTVVAEPPPKLTLISVEKIWDKAPHNAFTDLIRYNDQWVCAFREGPEHKGGVSDSRLRVLTSTDGEKWNDAGALEDPRGDIRDAKLAIMPDGRLMMLTAIQLFDPKAGKHQSVVYFTRDLKTWDGPHDVGERNWWLWGIAWHDGVGYSIGYRTVEKANVGRLYATRDGLKYDVLVEQLDTGTANESAIVFDGETAICLLRRSGPGAVGYARPPYSQWTWKPLEVNVGGPELIQLPDGRFLGGGRLYLPDRRRPTALFWVDPKTGEMTRALDLPSGGDTSYPGFVLHDGVLYVSYYSSHEGGKSSIYLAKVGIDGLSKTAR